MDEALAHIADQMEEAALAPPSPTPDPNPPGNGTAAEIVRLLMEAANLAASMGRGDWERKMRGLIRQISGRNPSSPVQLRPVGPVETLGDWVTMVHTALEQFAVEVRQA